MTRKAKRKDISIIRKVLKNELHRKWFWYFLLLLIKMRKIFKQTHWSKKRNLESMFAKRLSISSAIYIILKKKFGEKKAYEITQQIIVPIGVNEQLDNIRDITFENKYPIENLLAFYGFMGTKGVGRFVDRKIVKAVPDYLHFNVKNCFFHRFYTEVGTSELTKLFCEVDNHFFAKAYPDFHFHRGDSLENTIAYGKTYCTFIFEKRSEVDNEK